MKHERATEELRELAALYALGSLTQPEARSFETHLREGCAVCEAECRRFSRSAASIGLAAEEIEPPEYVNDLLLARIEREPQDRAQKESTSSESARPSPLAPPLTPRRRKGRSGILPWFLVAILLVAAALAGFLWHTGERRNAALQAELADARTAAGDMRVLLGFDREKAAELDRILDAAGRTGTRMSRLLAQAAPIAASGAVIWDTQKGECLVMGDFPRPPEGKRYHLWFLNPTTKALAGAFETNPHGRTLTIVPAPRDIAPPTAMAVSLESETGASVPTLPYCAAGRVD